MNEPSHISSPTPPLALNELCERCMSSSAVAMLVLDKFEKQLAADMHDIEERAVAQDSAQVARTAHALKGAAGAVAAGALRDLAAGIETLARQDQMATIADQLSSLRCEVERCLAYLPVARSVLTRGEPGASASTEVGR